MKTQIGLLSLILLSACSSAPKPVNDRAAGDYSELIESLSDGIEDELILGDSAGISMALIDGDKLLWAEGFGYSDFSETEAQTAASRYRAGQLTQLLTAIAVLQQVEAGRINLDRPVTDYLANFSIQSHFEPSAEITVRQLLSHHSGLPAQILGGRDLSFNQLESRLSSMYLAHPPGLLMAESQVGYSLLGQLLEQVSGEAYSDYIARHILQPLAMKQSSFQINYRGGAIRDGREVREPPLRDLPAAGLVSSVDELAQLACALHRRDSGLLNEAGWQQLLAVQPPGALDFTQRTALGLRYYPRVLNSPVVGQEGATYGHRAIWLTSLEHNFTVIALSNSAAAESALRQLASQALREGLAYKYGLELSAFAAGTESEPLTDFTPERLAGDYATIAGLTRVYEKHGKLKMHTLGVNLDLVPAANGGVKPEYKLLGLVSIPLGEYSEMDIYPKLIDGRQLMLGAIGGDTRLLGEKIEPSAYPEAIARYFGKWVPAEPVAAVEVKLASIELGERDGYLTSSLTTAAGTTLHYPLKAIDDHSAVALGLGAQLGEAFLFYRDAGQPRINYSGLIFKPADDRYALTSSQ